MYRVAEIILIGIKCQKVIFFRKEQIWILESKKQKWYNIFACLAKVRIKCFYHRINDSSL